LSVLGVVDTKVRESMLQATSSEEKNSIGGALSATPTVKVEAAQKSTIKQEASSRTAFSDILIRAFNIKELLERLKKLLPAIEIRHLYILIDDISELPEDAMKVVVDAFLAPLNNWSDEFIKFKVAAYANRIYYGEIDRTKIGEVYLDLFSRFGTSDVTTMEEHATIFKGAWWRKG
jgi:hypothetical protein